MEFITFLIITHFPVLANEHDKPFLQIGRDILATASSDRDLISGYGYIVSGYTSKSLHKTFNCAEAKKAADAVFQLLPKFANSEKEGGHPWFYWHDYHAAKTVQGLCFLEKGEEAKAVEKLRESVVDGMWFSFFQEPSTVLASQLLKLGYRSEVIQYLEKARKIPCDFNKHPFVDRWIEQIKSGSTVIEYTDGVVFDIEF